jgi:probable F420-dependent oxidoreductase
MPELTLERSSPVIRLGINVPNFGPQTDARALLSWTRFAESNGFAAVVLSDHVAPTSEVTKVYPPPFYDPLTAIAWLAGQSENLLFATSVLVVPYRHPLLTARVSAMLHEISRGRFALGVGVGWSATEFQALGADYTRRGQITDDYLQVITSAWRQRQIDADLAGLRITDVATGPNPAGGSIPLWVGGSASPAIRRAIRFGTAWHPINPGRAWLQHTGLPALRRESQHAGASMPGLVPRIKFRAAAAPVAGPDRPLGVGTITQITRDIWFLAGLGADLIILDPNPDTPRPRDYACERNDLLAVRAALATPA